MTRGNPPEWRPANQIANIGTLTVYGLGRNLFVEGQQKTAG
jgi:hypothetical protein